MRRAAAPVLLVCAATAAVMVLALLATPGSLDFMQVRDMKAHGCPVKLLEMSQGMRLTYQVCLGRRVG